MRRPTFALLGLVLGSTAGCYTAVFDGSADGVFFCSTDDDCSPGQLCAVDRCVSDSGPDIRLTGPEPLSKFAAGEDFTLSVFVVGSDLDLDEPGPSHREGAGYLQVRIDGDDMGGPVLSGDISSGVTRELTLGPSTNTTPGLHRIEVQAFRLDGTPYANPSAFTTGLFWVDDGEAHVGIADPWPGTPVSATENLDVEIVSLNFQFIQPDFGEGPIIDGEGHTHVYVDADFPTCLPGCLFNYAVGGSLKPPGSEPATTVSGPIDLPASLMGNEDPRTLPLTASLNYSEHYPVPATSTDGPEWDDASIYGQFAFDTIELQLVE